MNTLFKKVKNHHNQEDGFQGNTRIGPVLEIATSCLYGKHGIDIRIWSLSEDNLNPVSEFLIDQTNS